MGEDLEDILSDLIEMEAGFDLETWKNKEIITKTEYMRETLKICREYFREYKNNYALFDNYKTHGAFETYCLKNDKEFDKILKFNRGTDIEDYLYSVDARIGIKLDKNDVCQTVFFKAKEDDAFIYYALPKAMFDKYETSFQEEVKKLKDNEMMYI